MSDSVRPHRRQPTRLPRPWDSPGKNTGVGCHFLLQRMKMKSESEVAQSCLNPHDPMDCSPPGSSIHGIFQARVLEWGAIAFSSSTLLATFKYTIQYYLLQSPCCALRSHDLLKLETCTFWPPSLISPALPPLGIISLFPVSLSSREFPFVCLF